MINRENFKEHLKCSMNTKYAIEKYLNVFVPTQGNYNNFKLKHNQKLLLDAMDMYQFNIVKKPRQVGASSAIAAYVAIKFAFNFDDDILYISNNIHISNNFIDMVRKYLLMLPRWVWGEEFYGTPEKEKKSIFSKDYKSEIILVNGNRIKGISGKMESICSIKVSHVIIDEAAHISNVDIYHSLMTNMDIDGKMTIISTPSGYDRFFYPIYKQSLIGENSFNIVEMHWFYDDTKNKELIWHKNVNGVKEIWYEENYDVIKMKRKYVNGWKPSNYWYYSVSNSIGGSNIYITQELDGEFV